MSSNAPPPPPRHLTCVQRAFLAAGSATLAFLNPHRGDMVATLSETTGTLPLQLMRDRMASTEEGVRVLQERPQITSATANPKELVTSLAPNTFGHAYGSFMLSHGYHAEERTPVRFVEDPELAFVLQRYRQVHDFWHVLSGLPTDVLGEVAQKWFELLQTGLPMAALSSFVGPLRLPPSQMLLLGQHYIPWAVRCSTQCEPLMSVYYEHYFELDLDAFRTRLRFEPAPALNHTQ